MKWDPLLAELSDDEVIDAAASLLAGQDQVRQEVASGAKSRLASLWQWVKANWSKMVDTWKTETPFGTIGSIILLVVKSAARFIWNGVKWVFHLFAGMSDEEIAREPEALALDLSPFAVMDVPGVARSVPLSLVGPASYGVGNHYRYPRLDTGEFAA